MTNSAVNLNYQAFGDKSSPPLLILHGLMGAGRNWFRLARRFAQTYYVIVPDLRAHGGSPAGVLDYPNMTDDLLLLIDNLQLNRVSVIGHSMGGKVAMWLALHTQQRVINAVIVDIAPVAYLDRHSSLIQTLMAVPLDQLTTREQVDHYLRESIPDASVRLFVMQNLSRSEGRLEWGIDLRLILDSLPAISGFPSINSLTCDLPVLFLAAANSDYIEQEYLGTISKYFSTANIQLIPDCGHWLHVDKPDEFFYRVTAFLNS